MVIFNNITGRHLDCLLLQFITYMTHGTALLNLRAYCTDYIVVVHCFETSLSRVLPLCAFRLLPIVVVAVMEFCLEEFRVKEVLPWLNCPRILQLVRFWIFFFFSLNFLLIVCFRPSSLMALMQRDAIKKGKQACLTFTCNIQENELMLIAG